MNRTIELVKNLYKINGKPLVMTSTQAEIFNIIFKKKNQRNFLGAYTQYGKTLITALAILTRINIYPEKWVIVAPDTKRAKIMIGYIVDHIFDNPLTSQQFEITKEESAERIRRERSKNRLTFKLDNGVSEVYIISAQVRFKEGVGETLMGFGAQNVIEEEASLIPNVIHGKVMRMLGGYKNNFLLKIGNTFNNNHFKESSKDPKYTHLIIDYMTGIQEGRITQSFIDEMEKTLSQRDFDILYNCVFPTTAGLIDWKPEYERIKKLDLKDIQILTIGTDMAISEKETADYSSIDVAVMGKDGKIYNLKSEKGRWNFNEFLERIVSTYKFFCSYSIPIVGIEDVAYQRVAQQELARRYGLVAKLITRTRDKRSRLMTLQPYFENGQIYFVDEQIELFNQLRNFGQTEHDDLVDSFEMAVSLIKNYFLLQKKEEEPDTIKSRAIRKAQEQEDNIEY